MNTLKKKSFKSVYLPVDFFYSTPLRRNVKKKKKKKKNLTKKTLNVKLLNLIMYIKQTMTLTLKFETFDNFPLPFNEFYDVSQDSFK